MLNPMNLRRRGTATRVPMASTKRTTLTRNHVAGPAGLSGKERLQDQFDDVRSELRPEGELGLEAEFLSARPRPAPEPLWPWRPPPGSPGPARSRRPSRLAELFRCGHHQGSLSDLASGDLGRRQQRIDIPLPRVRPGSRASGRPPGRVERSPAAPRRRRPRRGAASAASLSSKSGSSRSNSQAAALSPEGSVASGAATTGNAASIPSRFGAWVGPQSQRSSVTPSNPFLPACSWNLAQVFSSPA